MSRQDSEPSSRSRPRSNTTFASFTWRRHQPAISQSPPHPPSSPPSLEALIEALYPPAVPSPSHARALANALPSQSPLPRRDVLNPILNSLCSIESPTTVQATGFDILAAYWENPEASPLSTADRLSYLSLFLGNSVSWGMELWEPRFKALRAVTKYGIDIIGIETNVIDILQRWIEGAFEGLLANSESVDRSESAERERSLEILVKFLEEVLTRTETVSRITDEKMASIFFFYTSLVDRSISLQDIVRESPTSLPSGSSSTGSNRHQSVSHRRNLSSLSVSSLPSVSSSHPQSAPPLKTASECAIAFYLRHINAHLKSLSHTHLGHILPVLFRALASCSASLPRLSAAMKSPKKNTLEEKLSEVLNSLFAGPYAANCMLILRQHLFPRPITPYLSNTCWMHDYRHQLSQLTVMTSLGAHRTLRNHIRRALYARIARSYISREATFGYSQSGAPSHLDLQQEWIEKAWPKEDFAPSSAGVGGNGWDAARIGKALADSVGTWISHQFDEVGTYNSEERKLVGEKERQGKEEILEEASGILKDILQELDTRVDERAELDEDEARVIGLTLLKLTEYILPLKESDGTPFIIPIDQPNDAPTPILRSISSLLAHDHHRAFDPLLSTILIHVADHLTDGFTARLPGIMTSQHDLSPTSPQWLENWDFLLSNETLLSPNRPLTRRAILDELQNVYTGIRDMKSYRRPLADVVWKTLSQLKSRGAEQSDDTDVIWKTLGEEIVLRSSEQDENDKEGAAQLSAFLEFILATALEHTHGDENEGLETIPITSDAQSLSSAPSTVVSPVLMRTQTEMNPVSPQKEKDSSRPSVISMLSSLATGGSSRSHSQPEAQEETKETPEPQQDEPATGHREVSAVSSLVEVFSQLTFTPHALEPKNLRLALRVYDMLLNVISRGKSPRARLTALQFLMRLRVDRGHRLYFVSDGYDPNGLILYLAELVNRVARDGSAKKDGDGLLGKPISDDFEVRKARPRIPHEGQFFRGRVGGPSHSAASRSRSRTIAPSAPLLPKPRNPLWLIPETLPFFVAGSDSPSEVLVSYDPEGPDRILVLPISRYLQGINSILETETSWEILSYVLCHLPVQLSNKHLFCGPNCRNSISKMLSILCTGILKETLASAIDYWPQGLKLRDAHGFAYQTLSVLISYKRCFDLHARHLLVEVFQEGLNGQFSTIKCCLQALALSAFELQPSMTKCITRILEKLSQIMSNANMAVHILGFLAIVGSLPSLYVNFTEADFKMVFGVALQYLQHYNRQNASPTISWALSQYVRILSYSVLYTWFLSLKLPDRPRHIPFIARQLLLANEGNREVDDATEVCFDWLARYTYASADPRPASSALSDIVLDSPDVAPDNQKTWIMGNSVVTIRALVREGWVEVMSRRPSGFSRFICHIENVPMVGPGEVAPDLLSVPAALLEKEPSKLMVIADQNSTEDDFFITNPSHTFSSISKQEGEPPPPDPITGYVWSGSAPSQRRKQVVIDPAFLILQLSPFPDGATSPYVKLVPDAVLPSINKSVNTLDRIPVIDTHKVGILYVAPGQTNETEMLRNTHGSPAYTRFLEGIGRLIELRGQVDVYAGGLDPDEDGEYAYAWWDDIGQILYHTATMMPTKPHDLQCNNKKSHIGNDYVRIVWNDSGSPYRFETLTTQFQFLNIVIEPHSVGSIAAFSNNLHEHEYFKVTVQSAAGMTEFTPIGHFKLISAENLPLLVRQLSLVADWYAWVFAGTQRDTVRVDLKTNWRARLDSIRRIKSQLPSDAPSETVDDVMAQESLRDFTTSF